MITVTGTARLRIDFSVDLEMTEEQWDALSARKQDEFLDSAINWYDAVSGAEVEEFDIDYVEETNEEESA